MTTKPKQVQKKQAWLADPNNKPDEVEVLSSCDPSAMDRSPGLPPQHWPQPQPAIRPQPATTESQGPLDILALVAHQVQNGDNQVKEQQIHALPSNSGCDNSIVDDLDLGPSNSNIWTGEQLWPTTEEHKVLYKVETERGDWCSIRLPLAISFSEWSQEMVSASCLVVTFIPEFKWRTSANGKGTLLCTEADYDLMVERRNPVLQFILIFIT